MLDAYTGAFSRYLRTGTVGPLSEFCDRDADLASLQVYRNGFLRACVEALRASYPSVERTVGAERFPSLARPYVEAHPPRTPGFVEYGEDFPRFIDGLREMHRLDYLASFAALDRAWSEVYFAEDAGGGGAVDDAAAPSGPGGRLELQRRPSVGSDDRGAVPPAGGVGIPDDADALMALCGRLAPWARLVSLDYRVLDVWSRLRQDGVDRRTEVRAGPQSVLIWRVDAEVQYRDLAPPEHVFVARIAAGRSCGEAATAALALDAGFDLVATFASLLHHRIVSFGP